MRRSSSSAPTTARRSGWRPSSIPRPPTTSTPTCATTSAARSTASRSSTPRPAAAYLGASSASTTRSSAAFTAEANLPRTLAATAEGTPELRVISWDGTPASSQLEITFHYLKNIQVDRQAAGVLTNFDPAAWAPAADPLVNDLFIALGTRGNLGDRADVLLENHRFAVLEAQSVRADFATWRWYLYDRDRNEARLLTVRSPAGAFALGNPTVRAFTDAQGASILFVSGFAFWQGAPFGEAGQFIALRRLP